MALDVVAPERVADPQRRLDVHLVAGLQQPQRRAPERLGHRVEGEAAVVDRDRGEADAVDGDGVPDADLRGRLRRLEPQADALGAAVDGCDATALSNDPGEHRSKVTARARM